MREFMQSLYRKALRILNLGERRCGWCRLFLGWRFGLRGDTSHGICPTCRASFDADVDRAALKQKREKQQKYRQQLPQRSTLRRRTGGWSGAVAARGR